MKRELKFRAWDEKGKWFLPLEEDADYIFVYGKSGIELWDNGRPKSGVVLLQYTGLKDRNGTEIYEGDLIKHGAFTYEVVFAEYGWYARCNDAGIPSEDLKAWFANGSEIVGNIYETPK